MADNDDFDQDDFMQAMRGVAPIAPADKVVLKGERDKLNVNTRRQAATAQVHTDRNFLSEYAVPLVDPNAILEFKRDGVQHGVFKNIRQGHYPIEARLDLHSMTVEFARSAVFQFINDCMQHEMRCVLITHGKGEGREQPALLKSCVAHWLPEFPTVLAFHTASKNQGGEGATCVLLKKSGEKKQLGWELNSPKY